MLNEAENPGQVPGEPRRRWFEDAQNDLIVWQDAGGGISGFQLCYGKGRGEHALTWRRAARFVHEHVDDGEGRPFRYRSTPILSLVGQFDPTAAVVEFQIVIDPEELQESGLDTLGREWA